MSTLGITDLNVIEQMTLTEYNYRMYAKEYEMLTQEFERYKLAFAIRDAAATKKVGTENKPKEEYVFNNANDVLPYEENIQRLNEGKDIRFSSERDEYEPQNNEFFKVIAEFNKQ
ncbi:hypothetical protein [Staphylococcus aureus]|uniref:hypothetical protein n=1 Tax=Staphylococcus aureus TaxID=1280 RepID=UPI00226E85A6|nr:hypothetical protein [Staphylococcus aureus]